MHCPAPESTEDQPLMCQKKKKKPPKSADKLTCGKCQFVARTENKLHSHIGLEHGGLARRLGESQEFPEEDIPKTG